MALIPLTTQERAQQEYRSIIKTNNEKRVKEVLKKENGTLEEFPRRKLKEEIE